MLSSPTIYQFGLISIKAKTRIYYAKK